jgi:ATP-dependent DNA helicase RecG
VLSAERANHALDARLTDVGRLGSGEVADLLGVSRPTAVKRLAAMQDAGVVEWVGKSPQDPRAYWRLPAG